MNLSHQTTHGRFHTEQQGCEKHLFEGVWSLWKDWLRGPEIYLDNTHINNDRKPWKDVIGESSLPNLNSNVCLASTGLHKKHDCEVGF